MREGDEFRTLSGGRKKFLYSGSLNGKRTGQEQDEWSFGTKANSVNCTPRAGPPVNLDNVWSIRNVSLSNTNNSARSEPVSFKPEILTKTTQSSFYSRHGGMNGRTGSAKRNNQDNSNSNADKSSSLWSSSGHKLGSSSNLLHPASFHNSTDGSFKKNLSRKQNPSPFDYDMNDF